MSNYDLKDGFYACDSNPFWFRVYNHPEVGRIIIGFSIWKNRPGYRTLTIKLSEWLDSKENAKVKIVPDHDRSADREFIRDYRRIMRAAKEAAKP